MASEDSGSYVRGTQIVAKIIVWEADLKIGWIYGLHFREMTFILRVLPYFLLKWCKVVQTLPLYQLPLPCHLSCPLTALSHYVTLLICHPRERHHSLLGTWKTATVTSVSGWSFKGPRGHLGSAGPQASLPRLNLFCILELGYRVEFDGFCAVSYSLVANVSMLERSKLKIAAISLPT